MSELPSRRGLLLGAFILCVMVGIAAVGAALKQPPLPLLPSFVLATILCVLSVIDIDRGILPDWLTLPLIALGLLYTFMTGGDLLLACLGAVIGYAVIWALAEYWRRARGIEGIGLGDAKLLAAGGAWTGAFALPGILLVASALGLAIAVFKGGKLDAKQQIRFGPFLAIGIWLMWTLPII